MAFPGVVQWGNTEIGKNDRSHPLWVQSFKESILYPCRIDLFRQVVPIPEPAENSAQFFSQLSRKGLFLKSWLIPSQE